MGGNIFLLDGQARAVELRKAQYQDENSFRRLILEHPELLEMPANTPVEYSIKR